MSRPWKHWREAASRVIVKRFDVGLFGIPCAPARAFDLARPRARRGTRRTRRIRILRGLPRR
jgi:hypothetical protein